MTPRACLPIYKTDDLATSYIIDSKANMGRLRNYETNLRCTVKWIRVCGFEFKSQLLAIAGLCHAQARITILDEVRISRSIPATSCLGFVLHSLRLYHCHRNRLRCDARIVPRTGTASTLIPFVCVGAAPA